MFDPALKHHSAAYIKGTPQFADAGEEARFRAARALLLRKCLAGIGGSKVGHRVVMRGSVALEVWYGERARPAKDIDLVVTPETVRHDSDEGRELLAGLTRAVTQALRREGTHLDPETIPVDSIWTYERAEGRRLTFPWSWEGHVRDSVQVDIVFNERLLSPPVRLTVEGVDVRAVSPAESLAWKLLWLASDAWPQGKDLYDAVLLAENVALPPGFLRQVFKERLGPSWDESLNAGVFEPARYADWPNFVLEHPSLAPGTAEEFSARLEQALQRGDAP